MCLRTEKMTTTKVTKDNIESAPYDNVVSYLDNRSIISDPRATTYSKRQFIYDTDPLMKSLNFGDFPYIIAEFPTVDYDNTSTNGKVKNIMWTMNLTVRTAREGANQGTDNKGKQDMFSIADDLHSLFNSITYKQEFQDLNMSFIKLIKDDSSSPMIDEKYLYENNYTLSFMTRIEVSS